MKKIHIDRPIGPAPGELSARWLRSQLPTDGSDVTLMVHCEGGSVFEAMAMHDSLAAYPGRVQATVSAMALSAATIVLAACDEVSISRNGYVMIHDPHAVHDDCTPAEQALLSSMTDRFVELYSARTKQPASTIRRHMQAETFFDAAGSVAIGLADKVTDSIAARFVPARIAAMARSKPTSKQATRPATHLWQEAINATLTETRGNRRRAVQLVARRRPQLRAQLITEANAIPRQANRPVARRASQVISARRFQSEVARMTAAGMTKLAAVKQLSKEYGLS